ncbi:MAG: hypothetical protein EHM38_01480, partial [Geobacteraceae bacterium]
MDKITDYPCSCQDLREEASRGGCAAVAPGGSLPCLKSNNSTEIDSETERIEVVSALVEFLAPYHKKQAHTLLLNCKRLIDLAPSIGHVGFLTLTFPDNVQDSREALKRFNSMNSHFFNPCPDFLQWICCKEVQLRGAWHYHLLVILAQDIREGFNFSEYAEFHDQVTPGMHPKEKRKLERLATRSANDYLRFLWSTIRGRMSAFGFGRFQLLPIRESADIMAFYMSKYIGKVFSCGKRPEQMRGVRLVSYSQGWAKNSPKFQWHSEGSQE